MLLRLPKKITIRPKTWATLGTIPISKKITMPISILNNQKTCDGLGNLLINDWKEKRRRIGMSILHLVS